MYRTIAIAVAALALPSAPLLAQTMTGGAYVAKAGASDLYETQSSRLVLQSTANPQVREYATMMVTDHAKSTADVKAAAQQGKVRVPAPKLEPMQATMMTQLRRTSGTARDALYLDQQKKSHAAALATHQGYADNGTVAPLKTAATNIAPVVQHHIDMLGAM